MSSEPNGWQTPKTDWKGGDVPLPSSFRRIEGNAQAIEQGSRTLDPSQAPSGNTGSLRQILDWLANRIKAISGEANWYDSPAQSLKVHRDATSAHGATSSATANRMVMRDSSGRASFASPSSSSHAATKGYVDGRFPVPVTSLKKAQGSSSSRAFIVHPYVFAGPRKTEADVSGSGVIVGIDTSTGEPRWEQAGLYDDIGWAWSFSPSPASTVTWDYLTASGHPRVWAEVDDRGEIVSMWEAEDPADPEFPDDPPFEPVDGRFFVPVEPPDEDLLVAVSQRLERVAMPRGFARSVYAGEPPAQAVRAMLSRQLQERGLEEPPDIREALSIPERDRRYWYLQLYMRQSSRLLHDHRASTLIPLYKEMCRVDRRTGRLLLR